MKLTKQQQNGILFVLYVYRAGQCKVKDAAEQLNLPYPFLEQIARKLRLAGIVTSVRGPGGGFKLAKDPSIHEVIKALGKLEVTNPYRAAKCSEKRALGYFMTGLAEATSGLLARKISFIDSSHAVSEATVLDTLSTEELVN